MKHYQYAFICLVVMTQNLFAHLEFDIVYSDNYEYALDDTFKEIDYFPAKNYRRCADYLYENGRAVFSQSRTRMFHDVTEINFDLLSLVHDANYISLLRFVSHAQSSHRADTIYTKKDVLNLLRRASFINIADILTRKNSPQVFKVAREIIRAQRLGTAGTLRAMELAVLPTTRGGRAAINLSGGYHHAQLGHGSGFCLINDVAIAIKQFSATHSEQKILVVDLDAHFGDGNFLLFKNHPQVTIFDIYNKDIFPLSGVDLEEDEEDARHYRYPFSSKTKDAAYLDLLKRELKKAVDAVAPDIVFYNAGSDIYEHDLLGGFGITAHGIIRRDEIVFGTVLEKNPRARIVMVLSGGYATGSHLPSGQRDIFDIIGESIINLKRQFGVETSAEIVNVSARSQKKRAFDLKRKRDYRDKKSPVTNKKRRGGRMLPVSL